MTSTLLSALTLIAALGSGLMAGVFFAFSVFVMAALARLPSAQGIAAMQAINIAVINPIFMAVFMGTGILCAVLAVVSLLLWTQPGSVYLLAGALIYPVGSIGVTMRCNVPLNNALAAVAPDSTEGASLWSRYVTVWTAWNHLRTAACLGAAALLTIALA